MAIGDSISGHTHNSSADGTNITLQPAAGDEWCITGIWNSGYHDYEARAYLYGAYSNYSTDDTPASGTSNGYIQMFPRKFSMQWGEFDDTMITNSVDVFQSEYFSSWTAWDVRNNFNWYFKVGADVIISWTGIKIKE